MKDASLGNNDTEKKGEWVTVINTELFKDAGYRGTTVCLCKHLFYFNVWIEILASSWKDSLSYKGFNCKCHSSFLMAIKLFTQTLDSSLLNLLNLRTSCWVPWRPWGQTLTYNVAWLALHLTVRCVRCAIYRRIWSTTTTLRTNMATSVNHVPSDTGCLFGQ